MEEDWFEETVIFSIVKDIVDDGEDDDGSSSWEIIGQSSDDDDEFDCYSLDDDDDDLSLASHFSIGSSSGKKPIIDAPLDSSCVDIPCVSFVEKYGYVEEVIDEEEEENEDEDGSMDESDDEYDLDDELVPMCFSDRFEKQRIRKIGKRAYPRMNKSKKMPHYYNRPGCVYGKHGLGLKHSI